METMTKERPLPMKEHEVRAILDGRQTQFRRVVNQQPEPIPVGPTRPGVVYTSGWFEGHDAPRYVLKKCPYGAPGDRLWVRETFSIQHPVDGEPPPFADGRPIRRDDMGYDFGEYWEQPHYRATDQEPDLCCEDEKCSRCANTGYGPHWRSPVAMPRWASRILLEVVAVRLERLQEISTYDCWAEGIPASPDVDPRHEFIDLWDSINAKRGYGWDANPWVWVVEFNRVTP